MAELNFPLQQRHFMSYIKVEMLRLKNMNQNSCQKEINKKKPNKQTISGVLGPTIDVREADF